MDQLIDHKSGELLGFKNVIYSFETVLSLYFSYQGHTSKVIQSLTPNRGPIELNMCRAEKNTSLMYSTAGSSLFIYNECNEKLVRNGGLCTALFIKVYMRQ